MSEPEENEEGGVASESSLSEQKERSINHPDNFNAGQHSTDQSCNSTKSYQSKDAPIVFKDGQYSTDQRVHGQRPESRYNTMMTDPPEDETIDGHQSTDQREESDQDHQTGEMDSLPTSLKTMCPVGLGMSATPCGHCNTCVQVKGSNEQKTPSDTNQEHAEPDEVKTANKKQEPAKPFLTIPIVVAILFVILAALVAIIPALTRSRDDQIADPYRELEAVEGDLKRSQESIMDLKKDKQQSDQKIKEQQESIMDLQTYKQQSDQKIKEQQARIKELEEPALAQLLTTLGQEMKNVSDVEMKMIQKYAEDVTLDPDTAQPDLILSKDGKQVNHGNIWTHLLNLFWLSGTDNTERFSLWPCVLGKQSFSSGRFYYEVQVKGKTGWVLGVVRESINRKGLITLGPINGYWTIWLRNREYKAHAVHGVLLPVRWEVQKVGVFVDYEEGLVSFYDVEVRVHLYSFTGCTFTEKLYPYFSPCLNHGGTNPAPLIISPVSKA